MSQKTPETVEQLWSPKLAIDARTAVGTAGSCFAQHIARFLRQRGLEVIDVEPPPPGLDRDSARRFGYLLYSARYGNIYTVRQLLQLALEADAGVPLADCVWEKDGRFHDAFRPSVEPGGLATPELVVEHRARHLERVRALLDGVGLFVFTLGLTEAWLARASGHVYPTAPGTIAGSYDPAAFAFHNFTFNEIHDDLVAFRSLLKQRNPSARILLTVSPVPLTATATDHHVLSATTYSKSVLRAVAGQLAEEFADVDYFPSYEMIASPFSRARFYEDDLRAVREDGVRAVMRVFFDAQATQAPAVPAPPLPAGAMAGDPDPLARRAARKALRRARKAGARAEPPKAGDEAVCEDVLLDAFGR